MTEQELSLLHNELQGILNKSHGDLGAAEIHGQLCGLLLIECGSFSEDTLQQLIQANCDTVVVFDYEESRLLNLILQNTNAQLFQDGFEFYLLLPQDDESLELRLKALCEWCSGFLYELGKLGDDLLKSDEINEILRDLTEITKVNYTIDDSEENESYFVELVEFIKVSLFMIADTLTIRKKMH